MNTQFLKNYLQKMKASGLERKIPNISENNAEFIGKILSEKNPKNILEIGTANGYSALSFCYFLEKFWQENQREILKNSWSSKKSPLNPPSQRGLQGENSQNEEIQDDKKIWEKQEVQGDEKFEISQKFMWCKNSQNGEIRGDEKFSQWVYGLVNEQENFFSNEEVRRFSEFSIFTIEYAWNAHIEAIEHFKNCKMKNIFPMWGDAKKIIPIFENNFFDVIYIDAMKKEYLDYFLLSLPKAKNNAIFIIDDVEKFAHKMQNFYDFLAEKNIKFTLHKTDEDDSIMIIERKDILL